MAPQGTCKWCEQPVSSEVDDTAELSLTHKIDCPVCGTYLITGSAQATTVDWSHRHLVSAFLRQQSEAGQPFKVDEHNLPTLPDRLADPGVMEKIDRIIEYLSKKADMFGAEVEIRSRHDYSIAACKEHREFDAFLQAASEMGYVTQRRKDQASSLAYMVKLTLDGWKHAEQLRGVNARRPNQAFVAMWFSSETNAFWECIEKNLEDDTGYKPKRVDLVEHVGKICDRIIAEIRRSGLLIADFTGNRAGVYYEAGFAHGLNIPAVFTCNEASMKDLHFDTRQYNHIVWKDPEDVRLPLRDRINHLFPLPNRTHP